MLDVAEKPRSAASGRARTIVCLTALAAIAVVSRLPQLSSPHLLLDGDECVLGLMSKHFLEHREMPLFFWGQRYGLSTLEASAGAASFALFGVGPVPLKIAMLTLWIVGVLFVFLALARTVGKTRGFWITCVLLVTPAWAVWSMKARGGYLTAFVAAAVLAWLLARDDEQSSTAAWIAAGILTAIVWLAQPIWLPGVLPLVAAALVSRRRIASGLAYAVSAAAVVTVIKLIPVVSSETWAGPPLGNPSIWGQRIRVVQQIYINLTGSYYLTAAVDPPGAVTPILATVWYGVLVALVLVQIYRVATRTYCGWSHLLFASLAATLAGNWLLLFARDARYLLPMVALLVALAGVEIGDWRDRGVLPRRLVTVVTAAALVAGSMSMLEFRNFSYLWPNPPGSLSESKRLQQVINAVRSHDASRVYSMNGLLDTQLIFYSNERVLSRWSNPNDRHPAYVADVDRALAEGQPVAVVGYTNTSGAPGCWDVPICTGNIEHLVGNPERIFTVDGKYFVYIGADRTLLRKLGFELPD